jgi:O-acetylhomoserine (thiol)-lyase
VDVNYPGLGGLLTFNVGSKEKAFGVINRLKYAHIVSNIGDVKTLVVHPASTIAIHNTKEEQERAGVYPGTIRVSVGIEDIEDLKADFSEALKGVEE